MSFESRLDPSDPLFEVEYDGESPTGGRRGAENVTVPLSESPTGKTFPLWLKVAAPVGALLVIGVGAAAIVGALTSGGSSLAQQECSQLVISQMKSPATATIVEARTAGPFEGKVDTDTDTPEMAYITENVMSHAAGLDEISSMADVVGGFADSGGWPAGSYWVGGAIDGENTFGATVRNHFLCFVSVVDQEVTKNPRVTWFTG